MMAARVLGRFWLTEGLTEAEQSFATRWRVIHVVTNRLVVPLTNAQMQLVHLQLCGGDAGVLAQHTGQITALMNLLTTFQTPVLAAISDRYGRMNVLAAARSSHLIFYALLASCGSMNQRLLLEVLCCSLPFAARTVFSAAVRPLRSQSSV